MIELIVKERCSYIILVPENFEIKTILSLGWSGSLTEDLNVFHEVYKAGGLLFKGMGEFDDPEWGFLSIGLPETIKKILG